MPRSFAEIFADWETGRTSASGNHSGKSSGKSSSKKSTSKKNECVETNQPKVNPMELGLRRYGIVDKDKEALERAEEPRKQSMGKRKIQKLKAEDEIDLHGLTREEAEEALDRFFANAIKRGYNKVLIIHGKGNHSKDGPVLCDWVRDYLQGCECAGQSGHSNGAQGGSGATWVMIKRSK